MGQLPKINTEIEDHSQSMDRSLKTKNYKIASCVLISKAHLYLFRQSYEIKWADLLPEVQIFDVLLNSIFFYIPKAYKMFNQIWPQASNKKDIGAASISILRKDVSSCKTKTEGLVSSK